MQGEARNRKKRCFGALQARLHVQCTQDQLRNLTNCPLLIATHTDCYASTLKNARGSQKSRKEAFWHTSRAFVRAAHATSRKKPRQYRGLGKTDLWSKFRRSITISSTKCPKHRFERRRPPRCFPSPNMAQKGNLRARQKPNKRYS